MTFISLLKSVLRDQESAGAQAPTDVEIDMQPEVIVAGSKRVLILSASVGTGHIRAGQALEKAFLGLDSNDCIQHEDALELANPAFRNIIRKGYSDLARNAPELLGWIYDYTDRVWTTDEHGNAFERWNALKLVKYVSGYNPDIVVCTHPLPADMTSWLLCKKKLTAQHAVVITDYEINPMWLCHHYSMYFVAANETKEHLIHLGYSPERIRVTGIPVDPVFAQKKNKVQMRLKHGLNPDLTTILISTGGAGLGSIENIIATLWDLDTNLQFIAACGSNEELKKSVEDVVESLPAREHRVKIMGYTNDFDEFMAASDMLIGKPGGLTTSEALVKGLVFVIINPIPGQEDRNSDYLLENGVALRCNNLPVLRYKIQILLQDKNKFETLQKNALSLSHPNAALEIARELTALADSGAPQSLVHPIDHKCDTTLAGLKIY
jgi:processive 1,2-diacylglycerol beta-glucosyltransferase